MRTGEEAIDLRGVHRQRRVRIDARDDRGANRAAPEPFVEGAGGEAERVMGRPNQRPQDRRARAAGLHGVSAGDRERTPGMRRPAYLSSVGFSGVNESTTNRSPGSARSLSMDATVAACIHGAPNR